MTADARNTPDGTRPALLFSAINHAREWVAAEQGRRLPVWFAEHKNDPKIKEILAQDRALVPADPERRRLRLHVHLRPRRRAGHVRLPRPAAGTTTTASGARRSATTTTTASAATARTASTRTATTRPSARIDEEGASNSFSERAPTAARIALSEPGNLAVDRLQRRVKFYGNINYHTDGQLLLTPVSYTTDYAPPDSTIFAAMTGTDGDSAVFPYQPQRSSDLYESNGDTIDNGYLNYGIIGWTPEMDTCTTGGDVVGCPGFSFPDVEAKMKAVFDKNLAFALNAANSLRELDRPKNYDNDPNHYQIKPTEDIQLNRFDVSYGGDQQVEAIVRKTLGPSDIRVTRRRRRQHARARDPDDDRPGGRALRRGARATTSSAGARRFPAVGSATRTARCAR